MIGSTNANIMTTDTVSALAGKNPIISIQTQNLGTVNLIAGEQGIGNLEITKKGMYLVHIWANTTIGQEGWSQVGITKGGNLLTVEQNLYYQGAGSYYHSVIGLERFNAGERMGIYRRCSVAMTELTAISATYLGDF